MIIYVTHSYNYKDEVNKRIYSICGLIVNDDLNMKVTTLQNDAGIIGASLLEQYM